MRYLRSAPGSSSQRFRATVRAFRQHEDVLDGRRMRRCCAGGDRDLAQQVVGGVAVVGLGVGVDLEVLDLDAVVVAHALVHHACA